MTLSANQQIALGVLVGIIFLGAFISLVIYLMRNKNTDTENQSVYQAGEVVIGELNPKIPVDTVFYIPPCPLVTGLYAQSDGLVGFYPKNINTKDFKVLITDEIDYSGKNPVRKNYATVYQFSTCDNVNLFNDACGPYPRSQWELAYLMPYAGSAIVDGKVVHTYASYETRDRWPQGGFDCTTINDQNKNRNTAYLRSIYNTLTITELSPRTSQSTPGECLTVNGDKQNNPDQILITFKRQKQRKEYTSDTLNIRSPKVEFDMSQATKMYALDNRNWFDTDIDVDISNIILNLVSGFQVTCKPSGTKPPGELPIDNNPAPVPKM